LVGGGVFADLIDGRSARDLTALEVDLLPAQATRVVRVLADAVFDAVFVGVDGPHLFECCPIRLQVSPKRLPVCYLVCVRYRDVRHVGGNVHPFESLGPFFAHSCAVEHTACVVQGPHRATARRHLPDPALDGPVVYAEPAGTVRSLSAYASPQQGAALVVDYPHTAAAGNAAGQHAIAGLG